MPEELADLSGSDVLVGVETRIESKTFPLGRDRDGGDGRDFGPASGDNESRGFPFNRPGSLEVGNKRESALIQEDQAGSKPIGLFLYEAKRDASNSGWLVPGALWLSSAASGSSSLSCPSGSTDCRCNSAPGSSSGRSGRYVSRSKDPSSNRLLRVLSPGGAPRSSSAGSIEAGAVPYLAGVSNPATPSSGRLETNAPRSLKKRPFSGLPIGKCGLASKDGRLDAAFFRVFWGCHEVS